MTLALACSLLLAAAPALDDGPTISSPVGTGEPGFSGDGGPADRARLNGPFDVAFDAVGNLFLSDTGNHRIRRVDARTGIITTVAGSGRGGFSGDGGPAVEADLDEPYGLAIDGAGHLYFADRLNRRVRRVDAETGVITTVAGDGSRTSSGDGGPAAGAGLVEPNGVALDGDRLYIADVAGHRVRVVDLAAGTIDTLAGTGEARRDGDGGPARAASTHGPRAVAVAPDGSLLLVEREGNRVRVIGPGGGPIRTIAGTGRKGYSGDGGPAAEATFDGPKEIEMDPAGEASYVVDTENHAIRRLDNRTRRIATVAGDGARGGSGDGGPATSARLERPHGVAVGPDGALYIGDTGNHRIRRVAPPGPGRVDCTH